MTKDLYRIFVDDNCIAENVPLQFALILVKAIYTEFYAEPSLKVTIEREDLAIKVEEGSAIKEFEEVNE